MRIYILITAAMLCSGCAPSRIGMNEGLVSERQTQHAASETTNRFISVGVFGEVTSPGHYCLPSGTFLSQAVEAAGGIGGNGLETKVRVVRKGSGSYVVNLRQIRKGAEQDFHLQNGDLVFVPGGKPRL